MKLQLIEYTENVTDEATGELKRAKGTRLRVDLGSAVSLVDKKKVARRVDTDAAGNPVEPIEDGDRSDTPVNELPVTGDVSLPTGEGAPETPVKGAAKRGGASS